MAVRFPRVQALTAVASWPVGRSAAGVVYEIRDGLASNRAGVEDASFTWASVTKICTTLAVLVAVEEGILAFDDPAGPPGSTVSHLLAHASGLARDGGTILAAAGRRRIYSNEGFRTLGQLVADRSGGSYIRYLTEAVLGPLGLGATRQRTSDVELDATGGGSSGERGDPTAQYAALGLQGPLSDLLALARELLHPTIVHPSTLARATSPAFPGLPGVLPGFGRQDPCDWGLGFELRGHKRPHWTGSLNSPETFGHFGQAGGFLWVDPRAAVACAALTDRPFGPWAAEMWPKLSDAVLSELAAVRASQASTPPSGRSHG